MILVTGGTGLLGSYLLCRLFIEQIPARVIKRETSDFFQLRLAFEFLNLGEKTDFDDFISYFDWKDADVRDMAVIEEMLDGVNEIYHLAALVSFNTGSRIDLPTVNLEGTRNLVNLAIKHQIKKFHYVSSIASLSRNEQGIMTEEFNSFNFKIATPYSKSKYLAEMEVWRGYNEGLNGVIVNPAIILGAGDISKGSLMFFQFMKKGYPVYPLGKNGFVDARDVADFLYQLSLKPEVYGNRFMLVSDGYFYKDIFKWIATGFGLKPPYLKVNPTMAKVFYYLDTLKSAISFSKKLITKDILRLVNNIYEFDNSKVRDTIGVSFRNIENSISDITDFLNKTQFGEAFRKTNR